MKDKAVSDSIDSLIEKYGFERVSKIFRKYLKEKNHNERSGKVT